MKTRNSTPFDHILTPEQRRVWLATRRILVVLGELLVPLALGASLGLPLPPEAEAQELDHAAWVLAASEDGTIETHYENPKDELGRPIPLCRHCGATTTKLTRSDGSTRGVCVELKFGSGDGTPYHGEIEIEMHWPDGTTLVVHEAEVSIADGETVSTEIADEGRGFGQADHVTYRLLTPPPQQQ